jgi:hypothetical protein
MKFILFPFILFSYQLKYIYSNFFPNLSHNFSINVLYIFLILIFCKLLNSFLLINKTQKNYLYLNLQKNSKIIIPLVFIPGSVFFNQVDCNGQSFLFKQTVVTLIAPKNLLNIYCKNHFGLLKMICSKSIVCTKISDCVSHCHDQKLIGHFTSYHEHFYAKIKKKIEAEGNIFCPLPSKLNNQGGKKQAFILYKIKNCKKIDYNMLQSLKKKSVEEETLLDMQVYIDGPNSKEIALITKDENV